MGQETGQGTDPPFPSLYPTFCFSSANPVLVVTTMWKAVEILPKTTLKTTLKIKIKSH
jgi:hypothetical protein